MGERLQPVADRRRLLELEALGGNRHLGLELGLDRAAAAGEELRGSARPARRSSSGSIRPTQGAVQRLIWYCRQGRVRFSKMLSGQERIGNARSSAPRVSLTAPEDANGPK